MGYQIRRPAQAAHIGSDAQVRTVALRAVLSTEGSHLKTYPLRLRVDPSRSPALLIARLPQQTRSLRLGESSASTPKLGMRF